MLIQAPKNLCIDILYYEGHGSLAHTVLYPQFKVKLKFLSNSKPLTSYFDHFTDVHFHSDGRIVDFRKKSFLNFPVFQERILFRPIGKTVRARNVR